MMRKLAFLVASTVLMGTVVGGFTYAFFTATTGPVTSTFGSGTLSFTITDQLPGDDDVSSPAIIYVKDMAPGDTRYSIANITSTGTLDLIYRFNVDKQPNTPQKPSDVALENALDVRFYHFRPVPGAPVDADLGQAGVWDEFGQFDPAPGQVRPRKLSEWYNLSRPDFQGEVAGAVGTPLPAGVTDYVKISASLPLATGNAVQGGKAVFAINASGYQKKNHGLTTRVYAPVSLASGWRPTAGQSPILTRIDPNIDYQWDQTNMIPGNPTAANNVYIHWTGKIVIPVAGTYSFKTISDDGVALTIDGSPVVTNWTEHAETSNTGSITLTAGEHNLSMEVYDHLLHMTGKLQWKTPTAAAYVTVPQVNLKP